MDSPTVAVWRDTWLSPSETFIRDQVGHLTRWRPLRIGLNTLPDGLDVPADFTAFGPRFPSRLGGPALRLPWYARRYADVLRHERVGVLHAHFGSGAITVLPLARSTGIPLVATFHGYDVTRLPQLPHGVGRLYRRRLADVFDSASRLIAVSEFVAENLRGLGAPDDKVVLHHIGTQVRPAPSAAVSATRHGITFVGRLVAKKGVADLIEAVAQLPEDLRSAPVRIIGFGPLLPDLQALAARLGVHAVFEGRLSSDEVAQALSESAVFCAPSRTGADGDSEGLGMVFLEAALTGVPVVSYRHGGVPEAVADGRTGLLADEGDVAGLARALTRVLRDPELAARLGAAGRARVLEEFDVARQTAALEDLYDQVAREHPVRAGTVRR